MYEDSFEELAQNKLTILFLIKKLKVSITNSEICQFALENDFMDYFSVQEYLSDMIDSGHLSTLKEKKCTWYNITEKGEAALKLFSNKIPKWMYDGTLKYIKDNEKRLRSQFEQDNQWREKGNGDYVAECTLFESDRSVLMNIQITVPSKWMAREICNNWEKNSNKLYIDILNRMANNGIPEGLNEVSEDDNQKV